MLKDLIIRLREKEGLDQRTLAAIAGISPSTLSKIESGITKSTGIRTLEKLARALGVSVDMLTHPNEGRAFIGPSEKMQAVNLIVDLVPNRKLPQLERLVRIWVGVDDMHQELLANIGRLFEETMKDREPIVLGQNHVAEGRVEYEAKEE